MRSKAWLAASVSLRLARLLPLQAGCGACGCTRPSCACFDHKTVRADHIYRRYVVLLPQVKDWVRELHAIVGTGIVLVIAGNKADLERLRVVKAEVAEA